MNYLSVCSGIEAATVAWHPLGWTPFAFAEIEPFPCAVLTHHYGSNLTGEPLSRNAPPNLGDINGFKGWPDANIDVLVGGTPCQSFSVAGLRKGLSDPRGNLALTFLGIADRYRPEWVIWENVPGVLSQDDGRAFGSIIGGMAELGYGWAYRVLDAQFIRVDGFGRAVPQRRRRVFVVGCLGGWRRAGAVLFEPESLSGDTPPRRQAREGASISVAPCLRAGGNETGGGRPYGTDVDTCDSLIPELSHCLNAGGMGRQDYETETVIAHALRADGFDASEDGTGRGTPLVPVPTIYDFFNITAPVNRQNRKPGDPCHTLARDNADRATIIQEQPAGWAVRRLTPLECERLQGFPDGYTAVPFRNKPAADGPRYKALGNSMAVNAMRWLGRRIELVRGAQQES